MKPSDEELAGLRADALEDEGFRSALRASAESTRRWERDHRVSPASLAQAIERLTRLFQRLGPDSQPTRGERFPLL